MRISEALYQRLLDHAEKSRRSVSEIVRYAIREWIEEHEVPEWGDKYDRMDDEDVPYNPAPSLFPD